MAVMKNLPKLSDVEFRTSYVRRDMELPKVVNKAMKALTGRIMVEGRFASMATNLGEGFWLTTVDTVKTTWEKGWYNDILVEGEEVEYVVELPIKPLLLLKTNNKKKAYIPAIATLADMMKTDYMKLWRIGYSEGVFEERDKIDFFSPITPLILTEGVILYGISNTWFRGGADSCHKMTTLCFHCNFDYPHRIDYGSPVVLTDGSLAGILIGGDLGTEAAHQGAVMPIELIMPFVRLWAQRFNNKDFHHLGVVWQVPHY